MEKKLNVVDMHCDTILELRGKRKQGKPASLRQNEGHIDLLRLKDSGYLLQNFALFVYKGYDEDPWEQAMDLLSVYEEEMALNQDLIVPVYCYADIEKNTNAGKMSAMLTVEEGAACKGELSKLHTLYEKGVRMMSLTWNYPNELAYPNLYADKEDDDINTPDTENGLTETGRIFVEEMERIGMIVDVSHLSDAGFYDVLSCTKKPFVASHSDARSICPCVRNLTDDMIRALAERGGVMGMNFAAEFLIQLPAGVHNPGTIDDIVKHAKHIVNVGGIDVLGLGSDFDGIATHEELVGAQGMEKLYDRLLKNGFTSAQVDKIFSGNVLRVYKECMK